MLIFHISHIKKSTYLIKGTIGPLLGKVLSIGLSDEAMLV